MSEENPYNQHKIICATKCEIQVMPTKGFAYLRISQGIDAIFGPEKKSTSVGTQITREEAIELRDWLTTELNKDH